MPNLITATRCLANLPPLAPRWLWKDRLPKGKIVLLAGPSGSGKTFIALDIAARITTNKGFPEPVPCNLSPITSPPAHSTAHLVDFSAEMAAAIATQLEYDSFDQMTDEVLRLKIPPPV